MKKEKVKKLSYKDYIAKEIKLENELKAENWAFRICGFILIIFGILSIRRFLISIDIAAIVIGAVLIWCDWLLLRRR